MPSRWMAGGRGRVGISRGLGAREARVCQVGGVGSRVTAEVVAVGRHAFQALKGEERERERGDMGLARSERGEKASLFTGWHGKAGSARRAREE